MKCEDNVLLVLCLSFVFYYVLLYVYVLLSIVKMCYFVDVHWFSAVYCLVTIIVFDLAWNWLEVQPLARRELRHTIRWYIAKITLSSNGRLSSTFKCYGVAVFVSYSLKLPISENSSNIPFLWKKRTDWLIGWVLLWSLWFSLSVDDATLFEGHWDHVTPHI